MLDRERILTKLDEMDGYLGELQQVAPESYACYMDSVEKRRACERLLQISIECVIDVCGLLVSGLRLGLPAEEDDLIEKLEQAGLISSEMAKVLRTMKGFRNILVHEYGRIDNVLVFAMATRRLQDFDAFKTEILRALHKHAT
jgi:uncharacterized protein YutE (UPF0331/DUF86 family)